VIAVEGCTLGQRLPLGHQRTRRQNGGAEADGGRPDDDDDGDAGDDEDHDGADEHDDGGED